METLLIHIIFALAIFPVAIYFYTVQDRFTFDITTGWLQHLLLQPVVYYSFRVGLVLFWLCTGLKFSGFLLSTETPLNGLYLLIWSGGVIILSIKAHWRVEEEGRINSKTDETSEMKHLR